MDEADALFLDEVQGQNLQKMMSPRFITHKLIRLMIFSATFPKKFFDKIRLNENPGYAEMKLNPEQLTLKGVK